MIETLLSLSLFLTKPVKVALIDSGYTQNGIFNAELCDGGHVDFTEDGSYDNFVPVDYRGHGTEMAGLIHQYATGVVIGEHNGKMSKKQTNKVKELSSGIEANYCIVVIKVFGGKNGKASFSDVAKAMDYVYNNDFDIVNLSLGGTEKIEEEQAAVTRLIEKGIAVVAAAGNDNRNIGVYPFYPASSHEDVIVVGGYYGAEDFDFKPIIAKEIDKKLIYRSEMYYNINYNKTASSNFGFAVDVWMPGWRVWSIGADSSLSSGTGTSQAAASYTGFLVRKMIEDKKRYSNFLQKRF